jgi:hypothetical protein
MTFDKRRLLLIGLLLALVALPRSSWSDGCADWYNGTYGGSDGSYSGVHVRVGYGNYEFTAWYGSGDHGSSGFCPYTASEGGCGLYSYTYGYSTHYSLAGATSDNEAFFVDGPWAY